MNTQEALDAICEELDEMLDRIRGGYSSDIQEEIETLRKAIEWQPMETAPDVSEFGREVLWRFKDSDSPKYFCGDACEAQYEFGLESFNGWKEVE